MSDIKKGILIYNEWLDAMADLSGKDYKTLCHAIYQYQINDVPPPEFKNKVKAIAAIIFPCIERRKKQSELGRAGAAARLAKLEEKAVSHTDGRDWHVGVRTNDIASPASSYPSSDPQGFASSDLFCTPSSQSRVEKNTEENSIAEYSREERNKAAEGGRSACADSSAYAVEKSAYAVEKSAYADNSACADARLGKKEDIVETEGDDVMYYGIHQNVRLSADEYLHIVSTIPDALKHINRFSEKLYCKGYRYPNHARAILDWYERDKELPLADKGGGAPKNYDSFGASGQNDSQSTFDTDSFFDAAVRKTFRDFGLDAS